MPSDLPNGDKIIGSDYTTTYWNITGSNAYMDGSLTIRAGGVVNVVDGGLVFTQDTGMDGIAGTSDDHVYTLIVEDGGMLILNNSVLTTELNQIYDYPSLGVIIRNGAVLEAIDSTLKFPGLMVVDDSTLILRNSTTIGHDTADISLYCEPNQFQSDAFDDFAALILISSDVYLYDSTIGGLFEGSPDPGIFSHVYSFASDDSTREDVVYILGRMGGALGANNDAPGEGLENLTADDSALFVVEPGETLAIDGFDVGGLSFDAGEVTITLNAKYMTDAGYTGADAVQWGFRNGGLSDSAIVPSDTSAPYDPTINDEVIETDALPDMSSADLSGLNIEFANGGSDNVYFNKIWVTVEITYPAYRNFTMAGSTHLTAINTYIAADFSNDWAEHNQLVALDNSVAYLYGVDVDMTQGTPPLRLPAYIAVDDTLDFRPLDIGAGDTTIGQSISSLQANDNSYYSVDDTQVMEIDGFNDSGFSGIVDGALLNVRYLTEPGYVTSNYVNWSLEGGQTRSTSILPVNTGTETTATFDLYAMGVDTIEEIADLNVTFENEGGAYVYFEEIWIEVTLRPSIYMYRWLDLEVVDSQSLPVAGATVNATISSSGAPAYYVTPDGISDVPPDEVLEYLETTSTDFKKTGQLGNAMIPLLWEVVNEPALPNAWNLGIGSYALNVTYRNATGGMFYGSSAVDFPPYPALSEENQVAERVVVLSNVVVDRPDLEVTSLTYLPAIIYENGTVALTARISNTGLTAATNVRVDFRDFFGGILTAFANVTIPSISAGSFVDVTVDWSGTRPGTHTITAEVDDPDTVLEVDETNNQRSIQVNVLPFLPELSVSSVDIEIEPQPAYTGTLTYANVTIRNTFGLASAINASVEFYAGNPLSGGKLLGSTGVNVPAGGSNTTTFGWQPSQIGDYQIYVYVNRLRTISEYSYDNNLASADITVELSTTGNDLVVDDNDVFTFVPGSYYFDGNIVVKDSGTLILDHATLSMRQDFAEELLIVVQDDGVLILDTSTLASNFNMRLYLFDNATLEVESSIVSLAVTVLADDDSVIDILSSTIHFDLIAPGTSNMVLTAANTTFSRSWSSFGGNAQAYLTSVSIPALVALDGAMIWHYRWLTVTVLDGTGAALEGAYVSVAYYINGTEYANAISNSNGVALFKALCDRIAYGSTLFVGNYRVNATFWYGGTPYDTDGFIGVSLTPYSTPLGRNDRSVTVIVPDALPDLDPPFWVSDTTPARGQEVALIANITNIGVVPARDVLVRFLDNQTVIKDSVVSIINPGETVSVTATWVAGLPLGEHNLSVLVDPFNAIPEWDKTNNLNYTLVVVHGIARLHVAAADISVSPSSPVVGTSATVGVAVHNSGDIEAEDVNVTFYQTAPGGSMSQIGFSLISRIFPGQSELATVTWGPEVPGAHTITVVVDEALLIEEDTKTDNVAILQMTVRNFADLSPTSIVFRPASPVNVGSHVMMDLTVMNVGESTAAEFEVRFWLGPAGTGGELIDTVAVGALSPGQTVVVTGEWDAEVDFGEKIQTRTITAEVNPDGEVPEISYDNNEASQQIVVVDRRPDLKFVGDLEVTSGGHVRNSSVVGESVVVGVQVKNDGYTSTLGVEIAFFAMDEDGLTQQIGSVLKDISANATVSANLSWAVSVPIGNYSLIAQIDPDGLIGEGDEENNDIVAEFAVNAPTPVIVIDLGNVYEYTANQDIMVRGSVTNQLTGDPLVNVSVTVSLFDSVGERVTDESPAVKTNSLGYFETTAYIPPGIDGNHRLRVTVTIGGIATSSQTEIVVTEGFTETGLEWWVYVLIIAIVAAIIVAFSVYLYKYGLGKMVECGECGALIPESSRRCPKCGVEFETGTAKCSECGAWIPANSTECPECGAKFVTEPIAEEEDEYIKKMREQYEQFVDGYKDQAREVLGKKYSDAKFMDWWKKQPSYITFEKWLSQEEERRKLGAFACPVCGTLNPRGSTVCHKCGTVFESKKEEVKEEAPAEEEKPRSLRRIVRRPAEKKVLKKTEEQPPAGEEAPPEAEPEEPKTQ